jgi:type I restriction enzyme, S subunit
MNWQPHKLGEFISIKHGWAFKGEYFSDSGKYILLTPGNAHETGGLKLRPGKEKYYLGEFPPDYLMKTGDMLVVMTDLIQAAPILGGAIVVPEDDRFLHNQRLGLVELLPHAEIDKGFLYYLLNSPGYRSQVRGSATGATVRHTAPKRICDCNVLVPDTVEEQQQVAFVLSAYDDLIATNQRRIALLEDAARRLYREWFVHLRFPGHESVPVKDGVPEGWLSLTLGDVCDAVGGGTPSTARPEYWGGDVTWVTPTDVTRNDCLVMLDSEKKITEAGLANSSAKLVPPETILMTSRASIGFFALMDKPACTNQGFISVLPKQDSARMFLLFNLLDRVEEMIGLATGATFKELSKKTFRALPVLWPTDALLKFYEDKTYPLIQQVRLIKKQNQELTKARDLLLPKLMSGQLDVSGIALPDEVAA